MTERLLEPEFGEAVVGMMDLEEAPGFWLRVSVTLAVDRARAHVRVASLIATTEWGVVYGLELGRRTAIERMFVDAWIKKGGLRA